MKRIEFNKDFYVKSKIVSDYINSDNGTNTEKLQKIQEILIDVIKNDLSEKQRIYITDYFYTNLKMADIAKIHNVNVSTVSRTIKKAKVKIEKILKYYF